MFEEDQTQVELSPEEKAFWNFIRQVKVFPPKLYVLYNPQPMSKVENQEKTIRYLFSKITNHDIEGHNVNLPEQWDSGNELHDFLCNQKLLNNYKVLVRDKKKCSQCGHESYNPEEERILLTYLPKHSTERTVNLKSVLEEKLSFLEDIRCAQCQEKTMFQITTEILSTKKYLLLSYFRSAVQVTGDREVNTYINSTILSYEDFTINLVNDHKITLSAIGAIEYRPYYTNFPEYNPRLGHYVSYLKNKNLWYEANDSRLTRKPSMAPAVPSMFLFKTMLQEQ